MQMRTPLPIDQWQQEVVKTMRKDGIYRTTIDELFPGEEGTRLFAELKAYANSLESSAKISEKKSFFNDMWDMNNFLLDLENPFLSFTLDNRVLGIANAYLEMYSRLHSLRLMKTVPVEPGTPASQSQLWHRDNGDKRYFKVFLYLNDVEMATGPFFYVKGSQPGGKYKDLFPQITPYSSRDPRITDEDIKANIPEEDVVVCTGKAGTVIFVDTVGIHKGGYSLEGSRFTSLATFFSTISLTGLQKRRKFIFPEDFEKKIETLSPQAQYAIKKM